MGITVITKDKIDSTDAVVSVNGNSGVVVLDADDIGDGTTNKAFTATEKTKLTGIETGATADQTDAEIETAYNNQVAVASQVEAEAGTGTSVLRFTPERIKQAIDALAGGGGGGTIQNANLSIQPIDEGTVVGNARGWNAVDLQTSKVYATQIASGSGAFIGGGKNNTASSTRATVGGGESNTASNLRATVGGGYTNDATASHATVGGGEDNTASGTYSTASGGSLNEASGYGAFVGGGVYNTANNQGSTVGGGLYSIAYLHGQSSYSSERISSFGDSQYSLLVLRNQTTDATATELSLRTGGVSSWAVLPSNKAWRFRIELIGVDTGAKDTYASTLVGAIKRVGSVTSLVGAVTENDKVNDAGASTWSVAVTADDTNESLKIAVTGAAATTIKWCATVHLTEIGF